MQKELISIYESIENIKVTNRDLKSPLYYAGGKTSFVKRYREAFPEKIEGRYYEPFLGGGGVLFNLHPKKATVSDLSDELMNFYRVVKENLFELFFELLAFKNEKNAYYEVRNWDRENDYMELSNIERAARFYFLNQTSYAGLMRVNQKGQMNAPFGYRDKEFYADVRVLTAVSSYLNKRNITLRTADYKDALKRVRKGDFVFLDPPLIGDQGLTRRKFTFADYEELAKIVDELNEKGVKFLLVTENSKNIRNLFLNYEITEYDDVRYISYNKDKRTGFKNIFIKNY